MSKISLMPVNQDRVVENANRARAFHGTPPLKWDTSLQASAEAWASKGLFQHSKDRQASENLFLSSELDTGLGKAISEWYNEEKAYSYQVPGFSVATGHFTSLVWRASTRVGAAIARLPNGTYLYVMHLFPRGNGGEPRVYAANIPARISR